VAGLPAAWESLRSRKYCAQDTGAAQEFECNLPIALILHSNCTHCTQVGQGGCVGGLPAAWESLRSRKSSPEARGLCKESSYSTNFVRKLYESVRSCTKGAFLGVQWGLSTVWQAEIRLRRGEKCFEIIRITRPQRPKSPKPASASASPPTIPLLPRATPFWKKPMSSAIRNFCFS
jgi:hypothetical protein